MAEMLSPGVFIEEIDASTIAPSVSSSIGVFAGNFKKGPVGSYILITSVDELITYFGMPGDDNYNDWYQAYNFLNYANKLYVSRAANVGGTSTPVSGDVTLLDITADTVNTLDVTDGTEYKVGSYVSIGGSETSSTFYMVTAVAATEITLDRNIEDDIDSGATINKFEVALNGVFEAVDTDAVGEAVAASSDYLEHYMTIQNFDEFENNELSIAFTNSTDSKLKIISRNPGSWAKDLEIAIATPSAFGVDSFAFDGIGLDGLFEYFPTGTEVGVVIKQGDVIQEIFTVDFDETAKDVNGKSKFIENVINNQSNLIFVKVNDANDGIIKDYCAAVGGNESSTIKLVLAQDSAIQADDLANAYDLFSNKEEMDCYCPLAA